MFPPRWTCMSQEVHLGPSQLGQFKLGIWSQLGLNPNLPFINHVSKVNVLLLCASVSSSQNEDDILLGIIISLLQGCYNCQKKIVQKLGLDKRDYWVLFQLSGAIVLGTLWGDLIPQGCAHFTDLPLARLFLFLHLISAKRLRSSD